MDQGLLCQELGSRVRVRIRVRGFGQGVELGLRVRFCIRVRSRLRVCQRVGSSLWYVSRTTVRVRSGLDKDSRVKFKFCVRAEGLG